jgi:hypothetical protein
MAVIDGELPAFAGSPVNASTLGGSAYSASAALLGEYPVVLCDGDPEPSEMMGSSFLRVGSVPLGRGSFELLSQILVGGVGGPASGVVPISLLASGDELFGVSPIVL